MYLDLYFALSMRFIQFVLQQAFQRHQNDFCRTSTSIFNARAKRGHSLFLFSIGYGCCAIRRCDAKVALKIDQFGCKFGLEEILSMSIEWLCRFLDKVIWRGSLFSNDIIAYEAKVCFMINKNAPKLKSYYETHTLFHNKISIWAASD